MSWRIVHLAAALYWLVTAADAGGAAADLWPFTTNHWIVAFACLGAGGLALRCAINDR